MGGGDLKNMLLVREGGSKRELAEERLAAVKKRRLMENLERQDREKGAPAPVANPLLAAAPADTAADTAASAPSLRHARTAAQKREKAIRRLLMSVGFFDDDVEAQMVQDAAAADDAEQLRAAREVVDLTWFTEAQHPGDAAAAAAAAAASQVAEEKSKKELAAEALQMHKDLAALEEQAIEDADVNEETWHDGRAREDTQVVVDHLSRLDRIRQRRDEMLSRGVTAAAKPAAAASDSDTDESSSSDGDLTAWQIKRKK